MKLFFGKCFFVSIAAMFLVACQGKSNVETGSSMHYEVSFEPKDSTYVVTLKSSGWQQDTLLLKMPQWMPGYYQIMDYADNLSELEVTSDTNVTLEKKTNNTWQLIGAKDQEWVLSYRVKATRKFVANSYVDSTHAYLIPEQSFFYVDGFLNLPVRVSLDHDWPQVATGLYEEENNRSYSAPDFDFLYDCPILIGELQALPDFEVKGIPHRFVGYQIGDFDQQQLNTSLQAMIEAASDIIGDIPYGQYSFIGIGPGMGGIEHLNNTTVSFDGAALQSEEGFMRVMNFLTHEYFHHYNVKRIRPFELGPFDYDHGSKTNMLWISEGLTVYYEHLIMKRAGLVTEEDLLAEFSSKIRGYENDPGRHHQSLVAASYCTWSDGPFGTANDPNKSISYYQKGPIVGLLFDFAIRHVTNNEKSLEDVMRQLYWVYYKEKGRGFTDAEFQQVCEQVAGQPLPELFEYVYSTASLNYDKYLSLGGLEWDTTALNLKKAITVDTNQSKVYAGWLNGSEARK